MSVHFVYLEEKAPEGQALRFDLTLFDQVMSIVGGEVYYGNEIPDLSDKQWVYLDCNAELDLCDFQHPADDVVYCTGADDVGFSGRMLRPGTHVRIGTQVRHAFPILIAAAFNRWARV